MAARRDAVDACHRYLTSHLDQLRYDTALKDGWPIATGAVEGACRHLIADRLDITGARWGLHGAEAVLRLRAVVSNGDLDPYWRHHAAREHERLYPAPDQPNYDDTRHADLSSSDHLSGRIFRNRTLQSAPSGWRARGNDRG
ncbi:hypothetical protein BN159_0446 [Streptomyces davaonensis JCM 4913]|uniref:Transposase n=1 Tax=Streptomyces davaonensis (strain DSM 101723 / JCM 4913 / KCC S-0913 / 768) TaxID=1214101 RepID=K4QVJ4_STRDJ|nr:hypothetical protein BN159_0446 [Streptomyces davaonensis JCM 4913]